MKMINTCRMVSMLAFLAAATAGSVVAQSSITLEGLALDKLDDNRFFTRLGGTVRNTVTYDGVTPGESYTITGQLLNLTTGNLIGDRTEVVFTPKSAQGTVDIEMTMPQNKTDFNIDYVVMTDLYQGSSTGGQIVAMLDDKQDPAQTLQSHAIQGISVTATAADGSQALPAEGGKIIATVEYVNLVEGYAYTIWGQLMTPSGQSVGIFSSIPEYVPEGKAGSVKLEFDVPEGFEGVSLVPAVGLYHKKRVQLSDEGFLSWIPGSAMPVMIASDQSLDAPEQSVQIGVPFAEQVEK